MAGIEILCYGCCGGIGGLMIGGGLAALGYAISQEFDTDTGGDIFVSICGLLSIICGILCFVRSEKNGTDYDKVSQGCVGCCCGSGIFIALLVVHLSLRFTVYE